MPDDRRPVLVWGTQRTWGRNHDLKGELLGESQCNVGAKGAVFDIEKGGRHDIRVTHWAEINGPGLPPRPDWPVKSPVPEATGASVTNEIGYYAWLVMNHDRDQKFRFETMEGAVAAAQDFVNASGGQKSTVIVRAVGVIRPVPGFSLLREK